MTMLTMGHLLNTQISPLAVGLGTPCPLYWKMTLSFITDLLSHVASLLTTSTVGSRLYLRLALDSHLSYCICRFPPIASSALCISCRYIT